MCKLEKEIWGQRVTQPSGIGIRHYENLARKSDEIGILGNKQWRWNNDQLEIVVIFGHATCDSTESILPLCTDSEIIHAAKDTLSYSFQKLTPCAT